MLKLQFDVTKDMTSSLTSLLGEEELLFFCPIRMVYDSQKRLKHNETFEPDYVQISKSYILNLDSIIHLPQGAKKDADTKMDWIKLFLPENSDRDWIENMIFSQCAQSIIQILIVMLAEERWDRILAQQWVAEKMAFFRA